MTKNKLTDLNDHLFAELERLGDEDLSGDALEQELDRADGISKVATKVIDNADLALRAQIAYGDRMNAHMKLPKMLELADGKTSD